MSNRQFYVPRYLDSDRQPGSTLNDWTQAFRDQDNASFVAAVTKELQTGKPGTEKTPHHARDGEMAIGLIGKQGLLGYNLRRSQEITRLDRGPSNWSQAFLFAGGLAPQANKLRGQRSPWLLECSTTPPAGANDWMYRDGISPRRLHDYNNSKFDWHQENSVPNMAIISFALTKDERKGIREAALHPERTRLEHDLLALTGIWLHYLTNPAEVRNPLTDGLAMHSSAYVQMAYNAAGLDLTPSQLQNVSTPELIWAFAKHLSSQSVYWSQDQSELRNRSIRAWAVIRDPNCLIGPEQPKLSLDQLIST